MKTFLIAVAALSVLVTAYPATTTFANDQEPESLQSYCMQARVDAKLIKEPLHGNLKQICK